MMICFLGGACPLLSLLGFLHLVHSLCFCFQNLIMKQFPCIWGYFSMWVLIFDLFLFFFSFCYYKVKPN